MQAVILAGGLGNRLKPVTETIPKVLVPVAGKPFLRYLLKMLTERGIDDIVLCVGHLKEQVQEYFGDGRKLGMRIQYSEETGKLLGTAGALKQAQGLLQDYFLLLNGDTYLPINYRSVERAFLKSGKKAVMVVYGNRDNTGVRNNVALDGSLVARYDKRGADPNLKYVEAGALIMKREVLELVKLGQAVSLEEGIYPALIGQREVAAFVTEQRFYDIGTPEQLKEFEAYLTGDSK